MTKHNLSPEEYLLKVKERFLSYVNTPENLDGCWIWTGAERKGYGAFSINHKMYYAHRVSYELFVGDIPDNILVCHKCDTPICVNPSHLFLGTHKDNMTDRNNKNRQTHNYGEKSGTNKLIEQDIYQIREKLEQGHTLQEIAKMFGVSFGTISKIKHKVRWKHVK